MSVMPSNRLEDSKGRMVCPVCASPAEYEKCKVVCRSHECVYRELMSCSE